MIAAASYTPPDLLFDEPTHRYTLAGQTLVSVTGVLRAAGLADDCGFYTDEDRRRGSLVHAAIEVQATSVPAEIVPYMVAYQSFLAESAFRVDAREERLADPSLLCAGTLDLRGYFVNVDVSLRHDLIDVVDVKTGTVPSTVGYQTAGYVRLLPLSLRRACRRWCLNLRGDGTYRLIPLTVRTDEQVFLAALTIAHAKKGWLR